MRVEAKIVNPISIVLGNDERILVNQDDEQVSYPIDPGIMIAGEHYGFVIIVNHDNVQKEYVYPTQCRINAVGLISGEILEIFEDDKKFSWVFDKKGKLLKDLTDKFSSYDNIFTEHKDMAYDIPRIENPISIRIARNSEHNVVLKDETILDNYPVHPGVMFENDHYGFILKFDEDTSEGQREIVYPTQNRIDSLGVEASFWDDLKIYENGKFNPWVFSSNGTLLKESSYIECSRDDYGFIIDSNSSNPVQIKK